MVRIGILGAAGYTGGELIRILLTHPQANIVFANSESNAGNLVSDVHEASSAIPTCASPVRCRLKRWM